MGMTFVFPSMHCTCWKHLGIHLLTEGCELILYFPWLVFTTRAVLIYLDLLILSFFTLFSPHPMGVR